MTSNNRYKRRGWYGDSHGHSLAARGISLYAKKNKQSLVDPLFFAKREDKLPSDMIRDMAKQQMTFDQMRSMHPDADPEDLRKRAIKAIESIDGNSTLSMIDRNGVDYIVARAQDESKRRDIRHTLKDPVTGSFIPEEKRDKIIDRTRAGKDRGADAGLTDPSFFDGEVPY